MREYPIGPKEIDHHSPSGLLDYEKCPEMWARKRLAGEKGKQREPLTFGRLMHRVEAAYLNECASREVPTLPPKDVRAIVERIFGEQREIGQSRFGEVLEMALRTASRDVVDYAHLIDVEHEYEMDVAGRRFVFVPDAVFIRGNAGFVPDWKTSRHLPSQTAMDNDFKMSCCAAGILEKYSRLDMVQAELVSLPYGATVGTLRVREHVEPIKRDILRRIEQIEADTEFRATPEPPSTDSYCALCPFLDDCEAIREATKNPGNEFPVIVDDEQAREVLAAVEAFRTRAAQGTKRLKVYGEQVHGVALSDTKAYGPHEVTSVSWPVQAIVDACDGTETDWRTLVRPDKRAVEKAMKRDETIAEFLGEAAIETVNTKTELYTVKEID